MNTGDRWISAAIVALAFALRVACLDWKPAHFDEGVNGAFVDAVARQGYFAYDPTNFHGPLHFYLLFVSQTLFGRSLWALRMPGVLVSTACVAMLLAFRRLLGARACQLAAMAMAVSPGFIFYGRTAIHESEMVLALMVAAWGIVGRHLWGAALGLTGAVLTKETYVIHFAALAVALPCLFTASAWKWPRCEARDAAPVAAVCLGAIVFFYSGGFLHWVSLPGLWQTFAPWFETGVNAQSGHEKDWWYWLQLLARYEWPACVGLAAAPWLAMQRRHRVARFLGVMALVALVAYSAIAYKTPWCVLSMMWPLHLLFGVAVMWLARNVDRWVAGAVAVVALAASSAVSCDLNFRRFTDETEPYVYVQTLPDIGKLLRPLRALAARDPRNRHLTGHILLSEMHPLPWLLGDFTHVDFPTLDELPEEADADFLLVDESLADQIEPRLHAPYFRETLSLRGQSDVRAVLYLRAATFSDFFPERAAEFTPDLSPRRDAERTKEGGS